MGQGGFRTGYEVGMAKCYWRLGNQEMAAEMLSRQNRFNSGVAYLWAQMGELDKALEMVERGSKQRWPGAESFITGGDVLRRAGQYERALSYYNRASSLADKSADGDRTRQTAKTRIIGLQAEQSIDMSRVRDGRYMAQSLGYSGQIAVVVTVRDHGITDVTITGHKEKQYYSSLTDIPRQIIAKQNIKGIDATSSATITAEAIVAASAKALVKAMQ